MVLSPVTASQSGVYRFSDTGHHYGLDAQLAVYTNFNPANPEAGRLGYVQTGTDDEGAISLTSGVDYYLAVQPACQNETGDFRYVLLGPSPGFLITEGVNGAWLNNATPGQGILVDRPKIPFDGQQLSRSAGVVAVAFGAILIYAFV